MMTSLDEQTLHKVRHMASAGASPEYIASCYGLPVERVAFVCGLVSPGDRGTFGSRVPSIVRVDGRRDDPCVPVSSLRTWRSSDRRLTHEHAQAVANALAMLDPEYEAWIEGADE
jgi:hypothetical protein